MRTPSRNKTAMLRIGLGLATLAFTGCSICSPGFIDDYATVGGKWNRADPENGRVGSPFSDPGSGDVYGEFGAPIYSGEMSADGAYESGTVEIYDSQDGEIILESADAFPDADQIEVIPQYEGDSIILGDDW